MIKSLMHENSYHSISQVISDKLVILSVIKKMIDKKQNSGNNKNADMAGD